MNTPDYLQQLFSLHGIEDPLTQNDAADGDDAVWREYVRDEVAALKQEEQFPLFF